MSILNSALLAYAAVLITAAAQAAPVKLAEYQRHFAFHYDYVLAETAGLARAHDPVEVTLTVPGVPAPSWQEHVRVVRLLADGRGELVRHETLGSVAAGGDSAGDAKGPAPAASVNVVFLARCPAGAETTYRLFWGRPPGRSAATDLPRADAAGGLVVRGEAPGLVVSNEHYTISLNKASGAINTVRRAAQDEDTRLYYGTIPIHFGTDVWSPDQGWDHDYDWTAPPHQKQAGGATALRYHRWGPLQNYRDVVVSITYTFYAHVPYVHVSSTMTFTKNRSARAVRMGEIVVSHSHRPGPDARDAGGKSPDIFSHYAWPNRDGTVFVRAVDAHRGADGRADVEGVAAGALGILDRDVPWVAGYNTEKGYGMASLRRSQFAGNLLGGPVPQSAPCTYVANYGWGFTYWSRPMLYPLGAKGTELDQNTAIAAGTIFATEEALLVFEPDGSLRQVRDAQRQFTQPLQLQFKGTGPW